MAVFLGYLNVLLYFVILLSSSSTYFTVSSGTTFLNLSINGHFIPGLSLIKFNISFSEASINPNLDSCANFFNAGSRLNAVLMLELPILFNAFSPPSISPSHCLPYFPTLDILAIPSTAGPSTGKRSIHHA